MNYEFKIKVRALGKKNVLMKKVYAFASSLRITYGKRLSDEEYLKRRFKENTGETLNLQNPVMFNEKLQWLKIHGRNPENTIMADKYLSKKWVEERIGAEYIIPVYGAWEHFDEIDFSKLPEKFVLKCNHDCGSLVICKDKSEIDWADVKKRFEKALKRNYYWESREWPYKNIKPLVFAERCLESEHKYGLMDYKFFCFHGEVKFIKANYDKQANSRANFYTKQWEFVELALSDKYDKNVQIERPKNLEEMISIAEKLSAGKEFLRVDLYNIDGKIYVGELTFYPDGGMSIFEPVEYNKIMGDWITLPQLD